MEGVIVDASIAMTWCYPDEHSQYAYHVLDRLRHTRGVVPSLWAIEIANAVIIGERRYRLTPADTQRFLELLQGLFFETDSQTSERALAESLSLARQFNLSVYDATYLELAIRKRMPLATLDNRLLEAAKAAGVAIMQES